jgi:hypothetical protein
MFFVDQPFLPTVRQYVPVGRSQAMGLNGGAGGRLLAPPPTIHPLFWGVTVWAREIIRAPGEPVSTDGQIAGAGQTSSYYKIRVMWNEYPSHERAILLDAGSAVDLAVGPTTNLFVDLMAPDPDSTDPRPDDFDGYRVDVYIVASAWPNTAPIGHATGRFTQALYIPAPGAPPGVSRCVPVADGARTLQLLSDVAGEPSSARWSADDVDGSTRLFGNITINTAAGERGTDIVEIPQYAKAACFFGAGDTLFSVVQGLEL